MYKMLYFISELKFFILKPITAYFTVIKTKFVKCSRSWRD